MRASSPATANEFFDTWRPRCGRAAAIAGRSSPIVIGRIVVIVRIAPTYWRMIFSELVRPPKRRVNVAATAHWRASRRRETGIHTRIKSEHELFGIML